MHIICRPPWNAEIYSNHKERDMIRAIFNCWLYSCSFRVYFLLICGGGDGLLFRLPSNESTLGNHRRYLVRCWSPDPKYSSVRITFRMSLKFSALIGLLCDLKNKYSLTVSSGLRPTNGAILRRCGNSSRSFFESQSRPMSVITSWASWFSSLQG